MSPYLCGAGQGKESTGKLNQKNKNFNDPIYGFITIPNRFIFSLIEHPYFQRLRRITQMGMSHLVYPGSHHTRFHHALGSMHLMVKAIQLLKTKGVSISEEEENGLLAAILLHDVGHGPYSHAMENSLLPGVRHESISVRIMERLNEEMKGELGLAIEIFLGTYKRKFFCQLVSGQLDMDRLDYLKRDSFYTGLPEGNINSERIIQMLNVQDGELVVEEKGIYSVEKFLVARRLMYWQVYLHKTSLVGEQLLVKVLRRARELKRDDLLEGVSKNLTYFLSHDIDIQGDIKLWLDHYLLLDDHDVMGALKYWRTSPDIVLKDLSTRILDRLLLKIRLGAEPTEPHRMEQLKAKAIEKLGYPANCINYWVFKGEVDHQAYLSSKDPILIMSEGGATIDIIEASDHLNLASLTKPVVKYYTCYPKGVH